MNADYTTQDRGDKKDYQQYLEAMDAISIEKIASASVFFEPKPGNTIVDIGMASGTSSAILAKLFPQIQIIGVDINPQMVEIAASRYQMPNLSFRIDDGEKLSGFKPESVNGFFNCSSIHHITSYNNYDNNHAINTIKRQSELLRDKGILVIRDFVKPPEKEVILELSTADKKGRPDDAELFLLFAKTARSLAAPEERGFPFKTISPLRPDTKRFQLFLTDATEFIRRKDYYSNWEIELQEEYGYFTQEEFENCFHQMGLRIILSSPIYNQWIINNRYKYQFRLYDLSGNEIGFPPTNYIIAGEKVKQGKEIRLIRHLPQTEKTFLQYSYYKNKETNQIYDVVERPNEVEDIIPFFLEGNSLTVMAKHGYPRPLANVDTGSPVPDGKKYSGYIPEGLTISKNNTLENELSERFGIMSNEYSSTEQALTYYTSPGGINERVTSYLIRLNSSKPKDLGILKNFTNNVSSSTNPRGSNQQPFSSENSHSGFRDMGSVHLYDAGQLLNTAQTGALVEARLELNIYRLFAKFGMPLPKWLGETIEVAEAEINSTSSLRDILISKKQMFTPCNEKADFLCTQRACFAETGTDDSRDIFEYVYPSLLSSNTLVTLPVCKYREEIYVGLELRDLPVPQLFSGNCTLLTAPAKRLPKSVVNMFDLTTFISNMNIEDASVAGFFKLGEKYFPSIGLTTEQVYPYIVQLNKPSEKLSWLKLSELIDNMNKIEDAHLLICISRLQHALTGSNKFSRFLAKA